MNQDTAFDFSCFWNTDELKAVEGTKPYWISQPFIGAVFFSIILNIMLIGWLSERQVPPGLFFQEDNENTIAITLKKTPIVRRSNHSDLEFKKPENKRIESVVVNESNILKKPLIIENTNNNLQHQNPLPYEASTGYPENKTHQNIFDPRLRKKLNGIRRGLRESDKSLYLNNYTALDESEYVSFGNKCFNIKSLDGGVRDKRIWITACRGKKSVSEKMMDNANRYMQKTLK